MGKFSDYLDIMKTQTDTLREVVSEKSGVDCSEMSIGSVAEVVKDIETGGKDPVLQEKSVDPKTYSQEVTADEGYDGLSKVNVGAVTSNIDANITPTNIRAGVSILGVQGNLSADKPDQTKTVTPTTSRQEVVADTGYELGEVIVEAVTSDIDSDIKASNIKRGINILGVDGTFDGGELQSKTVTPTTSEQNVTPDAGFYGLSGVKVNAVNPSDYYKDEEIVNVTPSTESQKITPTANKVFNEVNVGAVTSAIDSNILADNIKKDVTILGVTGTLGTGTDLSDTTATPSDVLSGKEFYNASGEKVSGTIETFTPSEVTSNTTLQTKGKYVDGDIVINVKSSSGGYIEVKLPSEFASANDFYYFKIDNDKVLISSNASGMGLWEYSINTKTSKQIYASGNGWKYFQQVGDKYLITSSMYNIPSSGILIYDGNTITREFEGSYYMTKFTVFDDKCFISSSNNYGIILYDSVNNTSKKIYNNGTWNTFQQVGENYLISSTSTSSAGILLYNSSDDTATKVYDDGSNWQNFQIVGDNCLIGGNSTTAVGLLLYNSTDNTVTQVWETNYGWINYIVVGNNCLIGSTQSDTGLLLYNSTDNTTTKVYETGYNWTRYMVVGNNCLISGAVSSSLGVLLYNSADNTVTQVYETGYNWQYFQAVGDKYLIGGYESAAVGVLLYNPTSNTVTQIYAENYRWRYFQVVGDKCLMGAEAGGSSGILLYNSTDDIIKKIYSTSYKWQFFNKVGDNYLIANTEGNSGILLYNPENDTITKKYSTGNSWKYFQVVGDNCLITGSTMNSKGVLFYDSSAQTVTKKDKTEAYPLDKFTHDVGNNYYIETNSKTSSEQSRYRFYYNDTDQTVKLVGYYI